jgi:hypothetical protein
MEGIDDYQFLLLQVLNQPKSRQQLHNFLKKEHNEEPLLFITSCQQLLEISTSELLVEKMNEIRDTFIVESARKQVNLPATIVRTVVERIKQEQENNESSSSSIQSQSAYNVFQPAIQSILITMEKDSFVRFVRNEEWKQYCRRSLRLDDIERIAIHKSQVKQMKYSVYDLERPYMIAKDLKMALHMFRDGLLWELLYSIQKKKKFKYIESVMALRGRLNIMEDEAQDKYGYHMVNKVVITLNCSAKEAFEICQSDEYHPVIFGIVEAKMKKLKEDVIEEAISVTAAEDTRLTGCIFGTNVDIGLPLARIRDMSAIASAFYLPSNGAYYALSKPTKKEYVWEGQNQTDPYNGRRRTCMYVCSWDAWEVISDNQCRFTIAMANNPGGKLSPSQTENKFTKWMYDQVVIGYAKKLVNGFEKALRDYFDKKNRPPIPESMFVQIANDNIPNIEQLMKTNLLVDELI